MNILEKNKPPHQLNIDNINNFEKNPSINSVDSLNDRLFRKQSNTSLDN